MESLLIAATKDGVQKLLVGAIIRRAGAVLIIERVAEDYLGGMFELPSGHVESGESALEALVRETVEETGLQITAVTALAPWFDYRTESNMLARQLNFEVSVADGPVQLNPEEHCSYRWCHSREELANLNLTAESKRIVEWAFTS